MTIWRISLFGAACICLSGQNLTVQQRIDIQQKLIGELRGEAGRYTVRQPDLARWNGLIAALENEVALLRTPRSEWTPDAMERQALDMRAQIGRLCIEQARYLERHPEAAHLRAVTSALEAELHALTQP